MFVTVTPSGATVFNSRPAASKNESKVRSVSWSVGRLGSMISRGRFQALYRIAVTSVPAIDG